MAHVTAFWSQYLMQKKKRTYCYITFPHASPSNVYQLRSSEVEMKVGIWGSVTVLWGL